jgi:hypothetical protein
VARPPYLNRLYNDLEPISANEFDAAIYPSADEIDDAIMSNKIRGRGADQMPTSNYELFETVVLAKDRRDTTASPS